MITNGSWDICSADDIFKSIFLNENVRILNKISLTYICKALIDYVSTMGQSIAWHQTGDKPIPEPMMTLFTNASMPQQASMSWLIVA